MPKKKTTYRYRNKKDLNILFYQSYDENFVFNKVVALSLFLENSKSMPSIEIGDEVRTIDKKFLESIRGQIYFSQFHQFEALFALLIAVYQEKPHWLFLTTYANNEIKEKVRLFIDEDYLTLTEGVARTAEEFIKISVFERFGLSGENEEKWDKNVADIAWNLKRLAKKYLKGDEYNAYKHGVRTFVSDHSVGFLEEKETKFVPMVSTENAITFLETKEEATNLRSVWMTTKHFNPQESFNNSFFMSKIVAFVKTCRLALLNKTETIDKELNLFITFDRDKIADSEDMFISSHSV